MRAVILQAARWLMGFISLAFMIAGVRAESNAVTAITAGHTGSLLTLRIAMRQAPVALPGSFSTTSPPRIVLDFPDTLNATGQTRRVFDEGELRHADIVQAA